MNPPTAEELKKHPVLGALDQFNLERLLQVGRLEQLRRNESLYTNGERAEKIWLVLDGTIKLTSSAANQREVILELLGPGDFVGQEAVSEERRGSNAFVLRDATLVSFPSTVVRTLWARNPEFAAAWIKSAVGVRHRLQDRITELAYGNIEDRLFRILVHLARFHGVRTKKGNIVLRFPLTHQELANLIGATRETTTLAIGRLRSGGAISFMDRKIVLKDKSATETHQEEKAG